MKKINIGLVGFGMSGRQFHLPSFINHPRYKVVSIQTTNKKNQRDFKKLVPSARIVTKYEEIITDGEIDLVVIATPNNVHYRYTFEALNAGKHVVCEKPFVERYNDALELFELAGKKGLILRVFHNRKYDGDILTLEKLMKEKDFGDIKYFSTRFDGYSPEVGENWRYTNTVMNGIYYDLAPHLVHHVVRLFGRPRAVFLDLFTERDKAVSDDRFELTMYYDTMVAYAGSEVYEREKKPRFSLVASKATYSKYGFDNPDYIVVKSDDIYQLPGNRSIFRTSPDDSEDIKLLKGQQYHFYDKLASDINNGLGIDEDRHLALDVILVMEVGLKSFQMRRIVDL